MAIVVSEETGSISIVVDGQIERGLDARRAARAPAVAGAAAARQGAAEARGRVHMTFSKRRSLAVPPPRAEGAVGRRSRVLLWMVVSGEETVERGLRVPLELQQLPAGLELLGDVPTTVDVRVRGASGTLSRVGHGRRGRGARSAHGANRAGGCFRSTPDQVRVPFGVEVVQVTPSAVAMAFEASADPAGAGRAGGRRQARARVTSSGR